MRILLGAALSLALSGTAFAGMKASFEWGPTGKCFDSKSPPFKVSSVPAGTTKLSFLMKDLDGRYSLRLIPVQGTMPAKQTPVYVYGEGAGRKR